MSELKACPFCGNEVALTKFHIPFDTGANAKVAQCQCGAFLNVKRWNTRPLEDALIAENARLCSLIQRMAEVGDELAKMTVSWSEWGNGFECNCGSIPASKDIFPHAPDCPVAKWQELKKEMEG